MASPLDLLFPSRYEKDRDIQQLRLDVCRSCDRLQNSRCTECGCIMVMKVKIHDADCPLGRWDHLHEENTNG